MPCTEVCVFPLRPGTAIGNPDHVSAEVFAECLNTVMRQPGAQAMRFGTWIENPSNLQLFVDWDERKNHEDFMATEAYGPFCVQFLSILKGDLLVYHVDFQPADKLRTVLSAPVTEVATFHFVNEPPADYLDGAAEFARRCLEAAGGDGGFIDLTAGITYQELEHEGIKGKAAVVLIGWTSVDAHTKFRKTQCFQDYYVRLLRRNAKDAKSHHVTCLDFRRGQH